MERKFESELGRDIAAGRRSKPALKLGVAGAALASCALLVCLAGMSIAMGGSEDHGGSDLTTVFYKESDEFPQDDCDPVVNRVMNLKYKAMVDDGTVGTSFTKFNYGMNFWFYDRVDMNDLEVGKLALTFVSDDAGAFDLLSDATATVTMTITGVLADGTTAPISYSSEVAYDIVDNVLVVSVVIPDLGWVPSAGDLMQVSLTIEILDHALHGTAVETPWARYPDVYEDHIGEF